MCFYWKSPVDRVLILNPPTTRRQWCTCKSLLTLIDGEKLQGVNRENKWLPSMCIFTCIKFWYQSNWCNYFMVYVLYQKLVIFFMQVMFWQSSLSSAVGRSLQKRFWEEDWLKIKAKVRLLAVLLWYMPLFLIVKLINTPYSKVWNLLLLFENVCTESLTTFLHNTKYWCPLRDTLYSIIYTVWK